MRRFSYHWTVSIFLLLPSWIGCATPRGPFPTTPPYGVNRVSLPEDLAPGDRVDILFEDGHLVSARVVDWTSTEIVFDHDRRRSIRSWREIAAVLEPRGPEPAREPSLSRAVTRFFLIIGAVALLASAAS